MPRHRRLPRQGSRLHRVQLIAGFLFAVNASASDPDPLLFVTPVSAWPISFQAELATSFPLYINEFTESIGYKTDSLVPNEISEVHDRITGGEVDGILVPFTDICRNQKVWDMTPAACMAQGGRAAERLYVVTHHRDGKFEGLRGKTLVVAEMEEFASCYLHYLTDSEAGQTPEAFFGQLNDEKKEVNAVIKVARRKADACLVTRLTYESMVELSPQLTKSLKVVAQSPEYPRSVLAFRNGMDPQTRDTLIRTAIVEFAERARGRQLLTIFRVDGFVPYVASDYEDAERVIEFFDRR